MVYSSCRRHIAKSIHNQENPFRSIFLFSKFTHSAQQRAYTKQKGNKPGIKQKIRIEYEKDLKQFHKCKQYTIGTSKIVVYWAEEKK